MSGPLRPDSLRRGVPPSAPPLARPGREGVLRARTRYIGTPRRDPLGLRKVVRRPHGIPGLTPEPDSTSKLQIGLTPRGPWNPLKPDPEALYGFLRSRASIRARNVSILRAISLARSGLSFSGDPTY